MALQEQGTAPYAPGEAVKKVLERYRAAGLPLPVTVDLLKRLDVGDSIAARTLQALKLLDFLDEAGQPTPSFVAFKQAPHDGYKRVLAEHLYQVYAPVFAVLGPNPDLKTGDEIESAFRLYTPDSLRDRMVTLFLSLCEYAEIVTERPTRKPGPKTGTARPRSFVTRPGKPTPDSKPPALARQRGGGEQVVADFGDAGTATLTVDVRWLELNDDASAGLRRIAKELRAMGLADTASESDGEID